MKDNIDTVCHKTNNHKLPNNTLIRGGKMKISYRVFFLTGCLPVTGGSVGAQCREIKTAEGHTDYFVYSNRT